MPNTNSASTDNQNPGSEPQPGTPEWYSNLLSQMPGTTWQVVNPPVVTTTPLTFTNNSWSDDSEEDHEEDSSEDDYDESEDDDEEEPYDPPQPVLPSSYDPLIQPSKMKALTKEVFYNRPVTDYIRGFSKPTDGLIGIEIECEGTSLFDSPIRFWECHNDGSLRVRNGHPPIEYVLRKPLPVEEIPKALTYLTKQMKMSGSSVEESPRASVHVHVNVQPLTMKETLTYICLYILFENLLVAYSGPSRVGNLFCLRAKDAEFWVQSIVWDLESGCFDRIFSGDFRYTSCNTASLKKFGSLEFRSMRGTVDQDTIQLWVDILVHLLEESKNYEDPVRLYEAYLALGPGDFFKSVFYQKPKMYDALLAAGGSEAERNKGILEGSIFVRDIASAVETWKPKIKVEDKSQPIEQVSPLRLQRYIDAFNSHKVYSNTGSQDLTMTHAWTEEPKLLRSRHKLYYDTEGWICQESLVTGDIEWYV